MKSKSKDERNELLQEIKNILNKNKLLTLSTIKGKKPFSCTAYYAYDNKLNLYVWSDRDSNHSKNIFKNPNVSVNISDTSQKWGSLLEGLQIEAVAKKSRGRNLIKAGSLYVKRFPSVSKYVSKVNDFVSGELESELFVIEPKKIKLLNENKFGKEIYKEVKF